MKQEVAVHIKFLFGVILTQFNITHEETLERGIEPKNLYVSFLRNGLTLRWRTYFLLLTLVHGSLLYSRARPSVLQFKFHRK